MLIFLEHTPAGQEPVVLKPTTSSAHLNGANGANGAYTNGNASHMNGSSSSAPKTNDCARTLRVGIVLSGGQAPGMGLLILAHS